MNVVERRKVMCSVGFNLIAVTCVLWSLHVLIEKTRDEVKEGKLRMSNHRFSSRRKLFSSISRMAILDEINRRSDWFYRRFSIPLCSMQNVPISKFFIRSFPIPSGFFFSALYSLASI